MEKLLSIRDLFKKSWELYKTRWWKMLLMALVGGLGSMVLGAIFGIGAFTTLSLGHTINFSLTTLLVGLVGALLLIILNLWIQLALMYMIKEEYAKAGMWDTLMMVWNKMTGYAWVAILTGLVVCGGFILLIIPGIIFAIWFAFSKYAFVVDDTHGKAALKHSKELVRGYWWPVLGRICLIVVVAILVSMLTRIGFFINTLVVAPFSILYLYIIYEDLKRVKNAALPMKVS